MSDQKCTACGHSYDVHAAYGCSRIACKCKAPFKTCVYCARKIPADQKSGTCCMFCVTDPPTCTAYTPPAEVTGLLNCCCGHEEKYHSKQPAPHGRGMCLKPASGCGCQRFNPVQPETPPAPTQSGCDVCRSAAAISGNHKCSDYPPVAPAPVPDAGPVWLDEVTEPGAYEVFQENGVHFALTLRASDLSNLKKGAFERAKFKRIALSAPPVPALPTTRQVTLTAKVYFGANGMWFAKIDIPHVFSNSRPFGRRADAANWIRETHNIEPEVESE